MSNWGDQRVEKRLVVRVEARVSDLTSGVKYDDAKLLDVAQLGICVLLPEAPAIGNLVRIDFPDGTIHGQIVHVTPDERGYRVGVNVFQVLVGRSDLSRLVERLQTFAEPPANGAPSQQFSDKLSTEAE
jgi:hypothetical protein